MRAILPTVVVLVVGIMSALGQSFDEAPKGGIDILHDLWVGIRQSGPIAMILLVVLWQVDRERRKLQDERDKLLERVLTAMHVTSDALRAVERIMHGGRGKDE